MTWNMVKSSYDQALIIDNDTGRSPAVVYDNIDAPLIAAAPNLLDACERMIKIFDAEPEALGIYSAHRRLIEEAIYEAKNHGR